MKRLAIIPARAGSKGIPSKNIQKLAGKPLIEYTIETAKKSKKFDKIILSTDSKKFASIGKALGAEVPFLRPKTISGSSIPIIDVIKHALNFLSKNQSFNPDVITLLQPTSPLRKTDLIIKSIRLLKKDTSCVLSVSEIKTHPYSSFSLNKKFLKPYRVDFEKFSHLQTYPPLYFPTGSIYTFWRSNIEKYNSIYGQKIKPILEKDKMNIDIDNEFDFFMAEMTLLHWEKFKKKLPFRKI